METERETERAADAEGSTAGRAADTEGLTAERAADAEGSTVEVATGTEGPVDDEGATGSASAPAGRAGRTPRDVVLSLLVLIVPVLVLVGGYLLLFDGGRPISVDPSASFAAARHAGSFPVLEPRALPAGWSVASATYQSTDQGGELRIGYRTPDGGGVQLVESDRPVNSLLPEELGATASPGNLVTLGGRQWRRYPAIRDGGRALVSAEDRATTVIAGTAGDAELVAFAGALR